MNIFIMILVALFMAGYYLMDSPSQKIRAHETEYAISQSDMRMIAQCATAVHNAQINGFDFEDVCVEQYGVVSEFICLNDSMKITDCENKNSRKKINHYIVTATAPISDAYFNDVMEVLEQHFSESDTFGLFQENAIMSGGTMTKRIVPNAIIKQLNLQNGQLIYLTQYDVPDVGVGYATESVIDINCPVGTVKTYRFGRWQCIAYNAKTDCGGDMIWDSNLSECVADESRKPLCASNQNAVMVDDVWECISPFPDKVCPNNMIARLNYNTFEWECVVEPGSVADSKKCDNVVSGSVYGAFGTTLRIPQTSCTDCERMITDPETCVSRCVPDASKVNDKNCYPGNISECSGSSRAVYFGFPNMAYVNNVEDLSGASVPLDKQHSQNRKFNCLDCGMGQIDESRSRPPYVAVCK